MNFLIQPAENYPIPVSNLKKISCKSPFKWLEIHTSGDISICCHTWLPVKIGNILELTPEEVLNNSIRLDILNSIGNGNFTYCTDHCPYLSDYLNTGKINPDGELVEKESLTEKINSRHWEIGLSYDRSCNLQCPSCRKNLILSNPDNQLIQIHNKVKELIQYLIDKKETILLNITGSGDPFASPLFWSYLVELSKQQLPNNFLIRLMTNGILMTEQNWNEIRPLWKHIGYVNLSIDAATESTYKIVRKNGNFIKLKKNLDFFDSMVQQKLFPALHGWGAFFVLQKANYLELTEFVKWQLSYKTISGIYVSLISQWGHLSDAEYRDMLLSKEEEIKLSEMLIDPIFNNPQIELGSISKYKH